VNPPEADQSDAAILDYYTDSGSRAREYVSAILIGLGIVVFLIFVVGLRDVLARAVGERSSLPNLAFAGGLAFALLYAVGNAAMTAVTATFEFTDEFELDPDTARLFRTFGFLWLTALAGMTGALLVAATSVAARRTRVLPGWLAWVGFVLTLVLLASLLLLGVGAFGFVVWVLVTSIVLVVRPHGQQ
jgi:nitrate reductase NapE component